jgi:mono/diheme cytochrome c family protein
MRARVALLTLLALSLVLVLTGCPQKTETEVVQPETPQPPPEPAPPAGDAAKGEPAPVGDVAGLVQERCTQCHGIDRVEKEQADAEEWGKIVKRMQGHAVKKQKTPITDDEVKQIVEYVVATYGKS